MNDATATSSMEFDPDSSFLQALSDFPLPLVLASSDGSFFLLNRNLRRIAGLGPGEAASLEAWCSRLRRLDRDRETVVPKLFFETARDGRHIQAELSTGAADPPILEISTGLLARTASGAELIVGIAVDISENVKQRRRLEHMKGELEREVSERTAELNEIIATLEREITERKQSGRALSRSRERLKQMSRRTLDILEADRRTISKELHDSIGASLAAIKFSLEEKERLRAGGADCLSESLQQEIDYLVSAIKDTKRISAYLRPSTLDDLGLLATINWYIRQFQSTYSGIDIDYHTDIIEDRLSELTKINLYRILQEALSNAGKHSGAGLIKLRLTYCDGGRSVSLFVEDDGRGFNIDEVSIDKDPLSGYGLVAMRERCEIFGGSFHLDSKPDNGTRINAILPVIRITG